MLMFHNVNIVSILLTMLQDLKGEPNPSGGEVNGKAQPLVVIQTPRWQSHFHPPLLVVH